MIKQNLYTQRKTLTFILAIVMVMSWFTMIAPEKVNAAAPSGNWTDYSNYDVEWYQLNESREIELQNAKELAGLAAIVNGTAKDEHGGEIPQDDMSSYTLSLNPSGNFNLSAHYWVPIGGGSRVVSGKPGGESFSGAFDGGYNMSSKLGAKITGLTIKSSSSTNGTGGYGLFGYVDGGSIINTAVGGKITGNTSNPLQLVGGIAGYIHGNISNCLNEVIISIPAQSSVASNIGGIAGAIESTTNGSGADDVYIKYCENKVNVIGGTRVGGIAGSVYAKVDGAIIIKACYNSGNCANNVSGGKAYTGGIVGYNRGHLLQCANTGEVSRLADAHYEGGLAGMMQGSNPQANAKYCFSTGNVIGDSGYIQALYSSVDRSTTMPLEYLFWNVNKTTVGQDTGPGWGRPVRVEGLNNEQFNSQVPISGLGDIVDVLNSPDSTNVFTKGAVNPTILYPTDTTVNKIAPEGKDKDTDVDTSGIFIDGVNGSDSNPGTKAAPVLTMTRAKALALSDQSKTTIYVRDTITVNDTDEWDFSDISGRVTVKRSSTLDNYVVLIKNSGALDLSNITIDGNCDNRPAGKSMFEIEQSNATTALTVNEGTVLKNNIAGSGGLIRVKEGNVVLNSGTLESSRALANGGAVAVFTQDVDNPSSLTVNKDAIIRNNNARDGGAFFVHKGSTVTLNGGTISSNAAIRGDGIFKDSDESSELILAPTSTSKLTFERQNDDIYLDRGAYLKITKSLDSLSSSMINIDIRDRSSGRLVSKTLDSEMATSSLFRLTGSSSVYKANGSNIELK